VGREKMPTAVLHLKTAWVEKEKTARKISSKIGVPRVETKDCLRKGEDIQNSLRVT